jgi:hypothetical protein
MGLCCLDMSFQPFGFCKQMLSKHNEGRSIFHEALLQHIWIELNAPGRTDPEIHNQTIVVG